MTVHFDTVKTSREVEYRAQTARSRRPGDVYRGVGKRLFDLALVTAASPVLIPLVVILALSLRFSGMRPLFVQERVGQDGRVFRMWKFRTMVENAETVLSDYLESDPEARAEWDAHQKLKSDPRITPIGRFLRKTSLDELPQFWNVFCGQMSIVGPRPMMVEQQPLYPGDAYYRMRPGITGLWQTSDRNNCQFRDRADFDTQYEAIVSLASDLRILGRTVAVVVRGTGY